MCVVLCCTAIDVLFFMDTHTSLCFRGSCCIQIVFVCVSIFDGRVSVWIGLYARTVIIFIEIICMCHVMVFCIGCQCIIGDTNQILVEQPMYYW